MTGFTLDSCQFPRADPGGDQAMVRYNKSILQHAEKDKVLRVFDGTRGEVTYRGAFELDRDLMF